MALHLNFTARDARKLLIACICCEVFLFLACTASTLIGEPSRVVQNWFSLNAEANIPTWFSSTQLLVISLLIGCSALYGDLSFGPSRKLLMVLAAGFLFLSMDETAMIHEGTSRLLSHYKWLPSVRHGKGFWMFPYICAGTAIFFVVRRDLFAFWKRFRFEGILISLGFIITVVGGVGLEAFGYAFLTRHGNGVWLYRVEEALEEMMEMGGESITLYGASLLAIKLLGAPRTAPASRLKEVTVSAVAAPVADREKAPVTAN
jgi:hypothetical protein